jgi:hypothetical protein
MDFQVRTPGEWIHTEQKLHFVLLIASYVTLEGRRHFQNFHLIAKLVNKKSQGEFMKPPFLIHRFVGLQIQYRNCGFGGAIAYVYMSCLQCTGLGVAL